MLESVSCNKSNEYERRIFLSEEQMTKTLNDFYRTVAEMAGYPEKEDTLYDCTCILIALNVQEAIIRAYEAKGAPRQQIMARLLLSGPKASAALADNEVVLQKGFICFKK